VQVGSRGAAKYPDLPTGLNHLLAHGGQRAQDFAPDSVLGLYAFPALGDAANHGLAFPALLPQPGQDACRRTPGGDDRTTQGPRKGQERVALQLWEGE